jgi:TldD protein
LVQQRSPLDFKIKRPFDIMDAKSKSALLHQMDRAAREYNPSVKQVTIELSELRRKVWIFNSDGVWAEDDRSFLEYWIGVTAQRNGRLQQVSDGFGAQSGLELLDVQDPIAFIVDIAQSAVRMLDARPAPAGEMTVVITNGWGGVLFHEACGHAMEADFVMKGASAYQGLVGKQVASPLITAIDDGSIPGRRGSYRFDDEGTPSSKTVLIEEGILREYMWDIAEARQAGHGLTGNGRRESYRHMPMPRMSNTYLAGGPHDPEEIIRSVKRGLFVRRLGGGQADTARGDFVFSVTEGYMIENGRVTSPVRGATIIGNGPQILRQIDMMGTDFALDDGHGRCGKGQWVRVSVGQPTIRVPKLVVGGTQKGREE